LQKLINNLSKEPLGSSLNLTYQYYVVLLDNMTLEHKKNMNLLNLKQREVKLNKLIDQINIRDQLIHNAKSELEKKGVSIKQNEQIKPLESLNIEHSFVLPVVISNNSDKIDNKIFNKNALNNLNYSKLNISNNESLNNSRAKSPYEAYNNPNIIKEKKKFKSKTSEIIEKAKKNELTEMRLHVINDQYPNSKIYYLNSKNPNKRLSNGRLQNVIALDTRNANQSFESNKSADVSSLSKSRREREMDKKVKNIFLKKNFVGRHKNSPYLKNFNEL